MFNKIINLGQKVLGGEEVTREEALELSQVEGADIQVLAAMAAKIREKFAGDRVDLCSIISAKSGNCSENCKFCAQSAHHNTGVTTHSLLDEEIIVNRAKEMEKAGAHHFDIVISGLGVNEKDEDFLRILNIFKRIRKETNLELCACLGTLSKKCAEMLKEVGVTRYNHNLETAESYFSEVVTTHEYQDRIDTLKTIKEVGLEVCCGGIIGLGETMEQRIELAFTLKDLGVDAVPINVLNPIKGTLMEDRKALTPLEVVKTFSLFRFILPTKNIRYAGGREVNLRDVQALGLMAGINGMLVGNYLTTAGREVEEDLKMLKDMGLTY